MYGRWTNHREDKGVRSGRSVSPWVERRFTITPLEPPAPGTTSPFVSETRRTVRPKQTRHDGAEWCPEQNPSTLRRQGKRPVSVNTFSYLINGPLHLNGKVVALGPVRSKTRSRRSRRVTHILGPQGVRSPRPSGTEILLVENQDDVYRTHCNPCE